MENTKMIGNISIERWKKAFAYATACSFGNDDFSDILFYNLYSEVHEEAEAIDEDDEDAICDVYNAKWNFAYKAFEEIFGIKYEDIFSTKI